MPKYNSKRLLIALIVGIVVLNLLAPVEGLLEFWFNAFSGLPNEVVVEKNIGLWMMMNVLVLIIFVVVIPMIVYVFLVEKIFHKSSLVYGLVFGLVIFFCGALSELIILPLLIKVTINFIIIRSFITLFNLVLVGGIIGGIYKPVEEKKELPETREDQSAI
jgi:hypothetical protein